MTVNPVSSHGDESEVDCGELHNWTEMTITMRKVRSLHVFNDWWV